MRRALTLVVLATLAACGREEPVREYVAPKDPEWGYRLLGAIAPRQGSAWFFKVVGEKDAVLAKREAILGFLGSVRFEAHGPKWTLPEGWKEEPGSQFRFATVRTGPEDDALSITVSDLPMRGSFGQLVADNVDRWRIQMGLYPFRPLELVGVGESLEMNGVKAMLVEFDGPVMPAPPKAMAAGDHPPVPREPRRSSPSVNDIRSIFAYDVPEGWVENPKPGSQRILEFRTGEGEREADVSFTIFPGTVGGLANNINRWRRQSGLEPLSEEDAVKEAKPFPFMGRDGSIIEAKGAENAILVVFTLDEEFSMFLKMSGLPAAVEAHRPAFESLAKSMQTRDHR